MTKFLCIYHGACDDGFAAAWVVHKALRDKVEFYFGVHGKAPPDVTGRNVIMVDFSYKRPVIEFMATAANSILILDHHKTAEVELSGFCQAPSWPIWREIIDEQSALSRHVLVAVIFNMEKCGATIAWNYFFPNKSMPAFLNYIEDRDLWRRQLPGVDEFTMALRSHEQDFAVWDNLVDIGPQAIIAEAPPILRYYRRRIEELKQSAYPAMLGEHKIWVCNAPYFAASEVAGELCEKVEIKFAAVFYQADAGRWVYSLRSRGEFDVSEIAKSFGGGGHKNAAGFSANRLIHIPLSA